MIGEIGQVLLLMALVFALMQAIVPVYAQWRKQSALNSLANAFAIAQFVAVFICFLVLAFLFLVNDFSVQYIAHNSNTSLPWWYRLSAVWGAHEGSVLLWILIYNIYALTFVLKAKVDSEFKAVTVSVLGWVSSGFLSFIVFTSNPFLRLLPYPPTNGQDLNPLLQDVGLIIHPPMLYAGYVGFAICFAMAVAALITKRVDQHWAKSVRPFALVSWMFLSLGITLGSWWAYYELGWGGWWFWDPVENASLLPWLVGTALIHSLAVTQKRQAFKAWSVLLAIMSFALSLLGTFLVRSGVLTSVHAFANDPERGIAILIFLTLVVGGALTIFAFRASAVKSEPVITALSREALLLINNLLLVVITATVLLGTIYPLIIDALALPKLSVGAPYFNLVVTPILMLLLFFMAYAPVSQWKNTPLARYYRLSKIAILPLIILLIVYYLIPYQSYLPYVACASICVLVLVGLLVDLHHKTNGQFGKLIRLPKGYYAMMLAHFALVVVAIGAATTSYYSTEKDVRLAVGESITIANYDFTLVSLSGISGPNYRGVRAAISVKPQQSTLSKILYPEKRIYTVRNIPLSETAIDVGIFRDIYIALGEPLAENAWSIRIYHKPLVRWLWLGGLLMMIAGFIALWDKSLQPRTDKSGLLNA